MSEVPLVEFVRRYERDGESALSDAASRLATLTLAAGAAAEGGGGYHTRVSKAGRDLHDAFVSDLENQLSRKIPRVPF